MKCINSGDSEIYIDHREINNYNYIIVINPKGSGIEPLEKSRRKIQVFGSEEFLGIPDRYRDIKVLDSKYGYDLIVKENRPPKQDLKNHINRLLNSAISDIEESKYRQQKIKDEIRSVLDANKEVHENDLSKLKEQDD